MSGRTGRPYASQLGPLLRRARESRNLTISEVAGDLRITGPAITFWEQSRSRPSIDKLPAIAERLAIPLDTLIKAGRYHDQIKAATPQEFEMLIRFRKLDRTRRGAILRRLQSAAG